MDPEPRENHGDKKQVLAREVWRAMLIAGMIDPCGEVLDLQLQAVWFPCFCIR